MATIFSREALIAKFEEIERTYSVFYSAVYPDFIYTPKTFAARTEEALTALAESLLQVQKGKAERLVLERDEALLSFGEKPNALLLERSEKIAAINEAEEQALLNLAEDALARSMQKSAYYLAQKNRIRTQAEEARKAAETAYTTGLDALLQERNSMVSRYATLIEEADAAYASALAAKKEELLQEEAKRAAEALEYNNSMEKEAVEYNLQAVNGVFDRANEDTVTRTSMMYEKMQACYDYLSNFTTLDALTAVRSDEVYSKYLGSYGQKALERHYQNLYNAEMGET